MGHFVEFKRSAQKELANLPQDIHARVNEIVYDIVDASAGMMQERRIRKLLGVFDAPGQIRLDHFLEHLF